MRGLDALLSPTFFPTELDIRDINADSTGESRRVALNSEDEDYYDNQILPFYEARRGVNSSEPREASVSGQDKGETDESKTAQETDQLRNQLKEAYYLLINAMNDINLDVQQMSSGLSEQQATSSSSSHSRDSLCSRLSAKNMDSDSWSSGGDRSPQLVSDTESLLRYLATNAPSGLKGGSPKSKSTENLSTTKARAALLRSASDAAIRYAGGVQLCAPACGVEGPEPGCDGKVPGTKEPPECDEVISSEELLQDPGRDEEQLNESSGSVNSLAGSSDSSSDTPTQQGPPTQRERSKGGEERSHAVRHGHGVTVNKMQEWMHKGRVLSSEMKQRIEGSAAPPQTNPCGCKVGAQGAGQRVKPLKAKSPTTKSPPAQHPGRTATQRELSSRGSSQSGASFTLLPLIIVILLLLLLLHS